jgi:uncharacterized protein (TIGR02996 family)
MVSRRTSPPRTRDQEALLRAIIDHPDEDAPRLVYADLLDEIGGESNTARAEFVRLQCVSARYAPWEPVAEIPGARRLAARLPRRYWGEWTAGVSGTGVSYIGFCRGFPETVAITAAAFLRRGGAIRAAAPLRRLELRHLARRCARLAACRHLHAIRELAIDDAEAGDHDVAELVEAAGVDPSARYAALESLAFGTSNHLGPVAFAALAGCGGMPRLRSLTVSNAFDFRDAEAETLANAKGFGRLTDLTLTEARVRGRGLAALLASEPLAALSQISLFRGAVEDGDFHRLSAVPGRPGLIYLDLSATPIRSPALDHVGAMLARSPGLQLDLRFCRIPPSTQDALVGRFGMRVLVREAQLSTSRGPSEVTGTFG